MGRASRTRSAAKVDLVSGGDLPPQLGLTSAAKRRRSASSSSSSTADLEAIGLIDARRSQRLPPSTASSIVSGSASPSPLPPEINVRVEAGRGLVVAVRRWRSPTTSRDLAADAAALLELGNGSVLDEVVEGDDDDDDNTAGSHPFPELADVGADYICVIVGGAGWNRRGTPGNLVGELIDEPYYEDEDDDNEDPDVGEFWLAPRRRLPAVDLDRLRSISEPDGAAMTQPERSRSIKRLLRLHEFRRIRDLYDAKRQGHVSIGRFVSLIYSIRI